MSSEKAIKAKQHSKAKQLVSRSIIGAVGILIGAALTLPFFLPRHAGMSVSRPALRLLNLMNALPMGKTDRVEPLIQPGKVFRVENNTRVRVLEVGSARLKVRVLEGENIAMDGWVPDRWAR